MDNTKADQNAAVAGFFRTVPNAHKALSTTELDLSAVTGEAGGNVTPVNLKGCYVLIQNASGGDLTVIRGLTGMAAPAAGSGKVVADGATEEFYVDSTAADWFIRASDTGLRLLFDTKVAKAV